MRACPQVEGNTGCIQIDLNNCTVPISFKVALLKFLKVAILQFLKEELLGGRIGLQQSVPAAVPADNNSVNACCTFVAEFDQPCNGVL